MNYIYWMNLLGYKDTQISCIYSKVSPIFFIQNFSIVKYVI